MQDPKAIKGNTSPAMTPNNMLVRLSRIAKMMPAINGNIAPRSMCCCMFLLLATMLAELFCNAHPTAESHVRRLNVKARKSADSP